MLTNRDREVLTWIQDYKSITLSQCSYLYFNGNYESCRRRLKQLEGIGLLKSIPNTLFKTKVYFQEKLLKDHELLVYEFLKAIKINGGDIINIENKPQYHGNKIIPDAFITFSYNKMVFFILLEVDLTHNTPLCKMQRYEELYKTGELQNQCYGTFPIIVITKPSQPRLRYNSSNFNVIYLDLLYNNINNLLLQNPTII